MGSRLPPVLANLYMEYLKTEILPKVAKLSPLWLRYIDDCFVIWANDRDSRPFLQELTDAVPSIRFSVECEKNGSVLFLDSKVIRDSTKFLFNIYRKPTHSNSYIHWFSNYSRNTKRGSLFGLFLRAYRICDEPFIDKKSYFHKIFVFEVGVPTPFHNESFRRC